MVGRAVCTGGTQVLLITGMPRSATSFVQKFFTFAHQSGDERRFVPDQELPDDDFFLKYIKKKYGEGSLYEDWTISRWFHRDRLNLIPSAVAVLNERWGSWGEPVLKHLLFVLSQGHEYLSLFSHVIVTFCDVDGRWVESIDNHVGIETLLERHSQLFQADDIWGIGSNWHEACWKTGEYCLSSGITVSMIPFGGKEEFVSAMCGLGYDQELVERYWSTRWQGSRFHGH